MALLVPIVLVAILLFLALRYRSRDGGLRACLWRVEQSFLGVVDASGPITLFEADRDALREAPEHLFRLVEIALAGGGREDRGRALAAIREYREFRGWKT
ncbi:hypothetical protein [Maricaulis sp.]|uniref:hypothetical protein n=1 Tax=Maricaulis sp. TaxID=1486257 RepID=UPI0025C2BA80|nr:hypothetical protein [Maricaulis sp.]